MDPITIIGAGIIAALVSAGPVIAPVAGAALAAGPLATAGTAAAAVAGTGSAAAAGLGGAAVAANPFTNQAAQNAGAAAYNNATGSMAGAVNGLNLPGVHVQVY